MYGSKPSWSPLTLIDAISLMPNAKSASSTTPIARNTPKTTFATADAALGDAGEAQRAGNDRDYNATTANVSMSSSAYRIA